jgi:hypothetical protein
MAAWRHTPVERRRQAMVTPSQLVARRTGPQQHHDEAPGRAKSPGATAATRSPWIHRLDHRGLGEGQQRRGKADRRGSIEAPSNGGSIDTHLTAGDGRSWPEKIGEGGGDAGVARAQRG